MKALMMVGLMSAVAASAAHDLYICAAVNKNYVIGSAIVTTNGLFRQEARGEWRHESFNDTSIVDVAWDPRNDDVTYLAALNGVWRTTNGGRHWRLTNGWEVTEARAVVVDPNRPDHVYAAWPDGITVSRDRGETWQRREHGMAERGRYTQTLAIDRTTAGRVLAGCVSGIYLSEDGAESWQRVWSTETTVTHLVQSPGDARRWLATTESDGVLHSADGGRTWTRFDAVPRDVAWYNGAFDASNPARLVIGSWSRGLMVSEDAGRTWQTRNAGLPESPKVWRVAVHPDTGRLYASVFREALYGSDDFGRTWTSHGLEGSTINAFVFKPRGEGSR